MAGILDSQFLIGWITAANETSNNRSSDEAEEFAHFMQQAIQLLQQLADEFDNSGRTEDGRRRGGRNSLRKASRAYERVAQNRIDSTEMEAEDARMRRSDAHGNRRSRARGRDSDSDRARKRARVIRVIKIARRFPGIP